MTPDLQPDLKSVSHLEVNSYFYDANARSLAKE